MTTDQFAEAIDRIVTELDEMAYNGCSMDALKAMVREKMTLVGKELKVRGCAGHYVPPDVIAELWGEIPGALSAPTDECFVEYDTQFAQIEARMLRAKAETKRRDVEEEPNGN